MSEFVYMCVLWGKRRLSKFTNIFQYMVYLINLNINIFYLIIYV